VLTRVPVDAKVVTDTPAAPPPESPFVTPEESKVSYTPASANRSGEKVPTLEEDLAAQSGTPAPGSEEPLTEREKKLVAARAAHAPTISKVVKPRLSFILSGGQAPVKEENSAAADEDKKPPDIRTLNE
jgi:hypothetical protein